MTGYQSKKAASAAKMFDREEAIEQLVEDDFTYIMQEDAGLELLDSYLRDGFKGYREFTDQELVAEIQQREFMKS